MEPQGLNYESKVHERPGLYNYYSEPNLTQPFKCGIKEFNYAFKVHELPGL